MISESCGEVYKTTFANRNQFIFSNDIPKEREYFMTLEMRKEIWKYDYEYDADSEKNMKFIYDLKSDILNFGFSEFKPINGTEFKVEELSELPFKKYELTDPIVDGTGPILFNQKYGVLAIGNVMAPDFVYLPRKKDKIMAESIRKILTE
ncbi:hypothetical protein A9Q86_04080 [Flavobacteriales bacterium 33_180_T64]|nr:hypothetical protein A9Q86_04080 [Flavobacteriales bacterium 33_180_T64]